MKASAEKFTIGQLAAEVGVTPHTLRYYEKMGLLKAAGRTAAGYRQYDAEAIRLVWFVRTAKELRFSLKEIRRLLKLKTLDQATCAEILAHAEQKIADLQKSISQFTKVQKTLKELAKHCPADNSLATENCPIIKYISKGK